MAVAAARPKGGGGDSVVITVKPVLNGHSQKEHQTVFFNFDYSLMHVKSVAECSKRAFCNTLDLH